MKPITEKRVQSLKFDYDDDEGEYSLQCAKDVYVNISFPLRNDFFVTIEVHQEKADLSHVRTECQLEKLINALSEKR